MSIKTIQLGAINAFVAITLGAFAAHGLKSHLSDYGRDIFHTAFEYHLAHSLALVVFGMLQLQGVNTRLASRFIFSGIILFSGSLYLLAVVQITWLGAITPFGGLAFLAGWGWLFWQLRAKASV